MYWKQRVPIRQKITHFIGYATIERIERVQYNEFACDDQVAQRDGFQDADELQQWFRSRHGISLDKDGRTEFEIIHLAAIVKVDEGRLDD
jgi:hypothetical protein